MYMVEKAKNAIYVTLNSGSCVWANERRYTAQNANLPGDSAETSVRLPALSMD